MSKLSKEELQEISRSRGSLKGISLVESDLSNLDLSIFSLEGANLERANMENANLRTVNLRDANLCRANLKGANLEEAILRGANLMYANIQNAFLQHTKLSGANLNGADLSGADLRQAHLTRANLKSAVLVNANLMCSRLKDADLSGANLRGAILQRNHRFLDANLEGVILKDFLCESRYKILIVDDDIHLLHLYREELEDEGFEVISACNGQEAMELFCEEVPDLVTLDILLPDVDGIRILRQMKEKSHKIPVIMSTAYDYRDDFAVWNSEAYIVKSSDLDELKSTIFKYLSK